MKAQFDNTIAELKRFKADMEKAFSDLSIGKVDKNSFKAFKQTVNKNFESVRAEIDNLNLAVSTINSQIKILGNGIDISKISSQFKDFEDYVQNTNNAIDTMIKKLNGQGISLMSFDDSAVNQAKSQIKEINKLLKSTDEFSDAKGSKYELFDTDQAQAELDVLARDLKNTLELIEKSESELSNFDKNSIGFEKTINQINILKLKAADLHDSIQQLMDIPDKTGEYTFGDSILISDDNVDKKVSEYEKIVKGTLDEIRESAIKTREELEKIVTPISSKTASAKISDKLNPNSAELVTGITIETKKMNKVYEQINSKKDGTSVTNETKSFTKVEDSVNSLTSAINTKTEAIKTEANTMELAARAEIKSIQKIIEALNQLIEKIENIPELKIPKEDTTIPSKESNISSGMKDAFSNADTTVSVEKTIQAIKEENSALEDTVEIKEKIAEVDKSPKYYFDEKGSQDYWNGRFKESLKDITATNEELVRMKKYYEDLEKEFDFSGAQKNATKKLSTYNDSSKYTPEFIERVNSKIGEIGQLDITKPEDVTRLKAIDGEIQKIVDDSKLLENKLVKQDSKIADIISQMKIFRSQNTNMSSSQKQNLDSVIKYAEELKNAGKVTAQEIEKIKISFSGLKAEVASTGNMGKNFFSQIGSRLTDMNSKFVAQFLSWQDWIRYIQQSINTVRELDTALTEMRKVSDESLQSLKNYQNTTFDVADAVGTTAKQIQTSTADYMRLGESLDEAAESAKTANVLLNVSEFDNIEDATKSLVAMGQAYKDLDKMTIVDKLNEVGKIVAQTYSNVWCYKNIAW